VTVESAELHFLSLCLLYPQAELRAQLDSAAEAVAQPWVAELAAEFAAAPLESLQIEHTRLFVNAAPAVPCPPYESAYVDGHLLTATTAAVAAEYAAWGLAQSQETADFLPVELQFVAYLLELAAQSDAPAKIEQARRRFVREHLRPWLPRFAADVQQHSQLPFYRRLGEQLAALEM